jgi:long-chain acyl-CoA synthetase
MVFVDEKDRFFSTFPMYRLHGLVMGLLWPLSRGAAITFSSAFDVLIDDMRALRSTVLLGAPILFERIHERLWENICRQGMEAEIKLAIKTTDAIVGEKSRQSSKRTVMAQIHKIFGGELRLMIPCGGMADAAAMSGLRALGFSPLVGLGTTGTASLICLNRDLYYRDGSVGLVTPDVLLDIADEGIDGVGEIRLRGEQVTVGYYKAPERTARRIRKGWFYTGVRAYQDDDGFVYVVGMKKNAFTVTGGHVVSPEFLEKNLMGLGQVREAAVLGYPLTENEMSAVALILPQEGCGEQELKRLVSEINATLPDYQRIREFVTLDAPLERGAYQKLRRSRLKDLFEQKRH